MAGQNPESFSKSENQTSSQKRFDSWPIFRLTSNKNRPKIKKTVPNIEKFGQQSSTSAKNLVDLLIYFFDFNYDFRLMSYKLSRIISLVGQNALQLLCGELAAVGHQHPYVLSRASLMKSCRAGQDMSAGHSNTDPFVQSCQGVC